MPRFNVYAPIHGTKYLGTYDAETAEEAIEKAEQDQEADTDVSVCHQCSRKVDELSLGEYTAEPDEQ
jgi:hypothetical protein